MGFKKGIYTTGSKASFTLKQQISNYQTLLVVQNEDQL